MSRESAPFLVLVALFAGCAQDPAVPRTEPCEVYRLPLVAGTSAKVLQGNHGAFSHTGVNEFAWDFDLPEGTPVVASADGVVIDATFHFVEGGPRDELRRRANRVSVDHGRGFVSVYQHLAPHSLVVKPGQLVFRGQLLGKSGNTGFSTQPHLHYEVTDGGGRSSPSCFGDVGVPEQGRTVLSGNRFDPRGRIVVPRLSQMPRFAYAQNDVELLTVLPVGILSGTVGLTGRALKPAERAVIFVAERDGEVVRSTNAPVRDDGIFYLRLGLGGLHGRYRFGVALADRSGRFTYNMSTLLTILP
jgi:murein DD-endopeptidase MepM/ murein hydrolase activator NlpD